MLMDLSPEEIKALESSRIAKARKEAAAAKLAATPAGKRKAAKFAAFMQKNEIDITQPGWFGQLAKAKYGAARDHR